eukprot:13196827-Alexandrium_andersonii.AAC.1
MVVRGVCFASVPSPLACPLAGLAACTWGGRGWPWALQVLGSAALGVGLGPLRRRCPGSSAGG